MKMLVGCPPIVSEIFPGVWSATGVARAVGTSLNDGFIRAKNFTKGSALLVGLFNFWIFL